MVIGYRVRCDGCDITYVQGPAVFRNEDGGGQHFDADAPPRCCGYCGTYRRLTVRVIGGEE